MTGNLGVMTYVLIDFLTNLAPRIQRAPHLDIPNTGDDSVSLFELAEAYFIKIGSGQ